MPAPESVLVVGAGPVGALNALGLARAGVHSSDPGRLATDLTGLRRLEHDQQAAVDRLMSTKSLETPSLIGAW